MIIIKSNVLARKGGQEAQSPSVGKPKAANLANTTASNFAFDSIKTTTNRELAAMLQQITTAAYQSYPI